MRIDEFSIRSSEILGVALFDTLHAVEADGVHCYLWLVNRRGAERFDADIAHDHFVEYDVAPDNIEQELTRLTPHVAGFRAWRATLEELRAAEIVEAAGHAAEPTDRAGPHVREVVIPDDADLSVMEHDFHGSPILEILIDGHAWESPFDAHFRFGLTKARMILTVRDLIELFWMTDGTRPRHEEPTIVARADFNCVCTCVTHAFFEAYGRRVYERYIHLSSGDKHIGFGLRKAKALLDLESEIAGFVRRYT